MRIIALFVKIQELSRLIVNAQLDIIKMKLANASFAKKCFLFVLAVIVRFALNAKKIMFF